MASSSAAVVSSGDSDSCRKQNLGVRITDGTISATENSEIDSSGFSRNTESELKYISDNSIEISYTESSALLPSSARLRSCDIFIGFTGCKPALLRFVKWLRAEVEFLGVSCFAADRSHCRDAVEHNIVETAMNAATFGVVLVTKKSFSNPYSIYELKSFLGKKNLVPIFFDLGPGDCLVSDIIEKQGEVWEKHGGELWKFYGGVEKEWKEAVNGLLHMNGLEAHSGNWRDCILEAILLIGTMLGRNSVIDRVKRWKERVEKEEFLFPRNEFFVGRKKELLKLELILFGDVKGDGESGCFEIKTSHRRKHSVEGRSRSKGNIEPRVENQQEERGKGKEPMLRKEFEKEIQMEHCECPETLCQIQKGKGVGTQTSRKKYANLKHGKGVACVSGERGIGKTELLLEFAYRFAQRYRMVLWVGGEARYIRQNYLNLFRLFEVDVSIDKQLCLERNRPRSFEELEDEAIRRVRKELMRDIPFLILIDNLEDEKDWWDAKNVMELLPCFGRESHVIISTCLPMILNLKPLRLSYLSGMEAVSLMKGSLKSFSMADIDALRDIGEKLGRHTFGLALVGGILSELRIDPHGLLDAINKMPFKDFTCTSGEDQLSRCYPFLMRLLDVCFLLFDRVDKVALRMALASGWFAPLPVPVSLLTLASSEVLKEQPGSNLREKCLNFLNFKFIMSKSKRSVMESSNMLVRTGFARSTTKRGLIFFHEIIKFYACKRDGSGTAHAMFSAVNSMSFHSEYTEHIWAASFILFKFGTDPAIIKPKVPELVSFIGQLALPLAKYIFNNYSRCNAALELLRKCIEALEAVEESVISQLDKEQEKSSCWGSTCPYLYREISLLKATLLETRAELMLKGGEYEIAEQLSQAATNIREAFNGSSDQKSRSSCDSIDHLLRPQSNAPYK
ncbi:uncharacterized protein LOC122664596 [Telopea speciosissima]|uniref:uncharacterized protein LOC122664596 n=1 Tax=Telopea speciosissima TaxID=54955 RepID=UPI001CC5A419|nr:uncharacterized protein LOC122664596 [Telopea speciosissima]